MKSLKDKEIFVEKLGVMEKPFLAIKSENVKEAVLDMYKYYKCDNESREYLMKKYGFDSYKTNSRNAFDIIFGDFEK